MPERFMREATDHRVPRHALHPALPTPWIILDDAALDDRPIRDEMLSDGLQAEFVEAAERSEAGCGEGSVEHVEVLRMVSVGTSILGDLDAYPAIAARTPATPSTAMSRITSLAVPLLSSPLPGRSL